MWGKGYQYSKGERITVTEICVETKQIKETFGPSFLIRVHPRLIRLVSLYSYRQLSYPRFSLQPPGLGGTGGQPTNWNSFSWRPVEVKK